MQKTMHQKISVFSWALYDFANTIFSMNIITLYFALWVTIDRHGEDLFYSLALSISMLLSAISAPLLGALSDRIGHKKTFLIIATTLCCLFTALIGLTHELILGLLLFAIANYCYQIADVFYNSLLIHVSHEHNVGRVSGYGVGLGYVGTIVGLTIVGPFVLHFGRQSAFIPTAIFFLLFALPCFFFVKERKIKSIENKLSFWKQLKVFVNHRSQYKGILTYLIAIFIALNAVNTIFIFMSVFTKKIIAFSDSEMLVFYIISSFFAILSAFISGKMADRYGAKRVLITILFLWILSILMAIFTFHQQIFWIIGPLVGISLGGTWTSARALMIELSPKEMVGEMFGFYGLVGKTASIIGPLIWGASIWLFKDYGLLKYRIAMFILILFLSAGLLVLHYVPARGKSHG